MKRLLLIIFLGALFQIQPEAQVTDYARKVVDTLASDAYKGRGYVDEGDKLAADFIRREFKKYKLKSFTEDYFQNFSTPVNTFPNQIVLKVDGIQLSAGSDFLVDAGSPGISGSFETISITALDLISDERLIPKLQQSEDKVIVIENFSRDAFTKEEQERIDAIIGFLKHHENNPAEATILLTEEKLTWSASTSVNPQPFFTIHADSVPDSISQVEVELQNKFQPQYPSQNVIGYVEGENQDSTIVFIAHYDHLGMLGTEAIFNGANDNASGVAMMLSLARYYSRQKPKFNTIFIAFGAEELGLVGSKFLTKNPPFDLSNIKFLINFDISGTGDDGIQVVNGSVYLENFEKLVHINDEKELLPQVKIRGSACNSDHCMFDQQKVPNFYIYTLGGIKAYHDIYDRPETLPLTEFEDYFTLITKFIAQISN